MTLKDTKTTKKKSENGKVGFHRWLPNFGGPFPRFEG